MLDFSHVPNQQAAKVDYFFALNANEWQAWNKPRNCTMISIFCLGGGGGGGGGRASATTTARGGGAGGGQSNPSNLLIPAFLLPDILYVQVGQGGAGSTGSAVNGSSGGLSYVSVRPTGTQYYIILYSAAGSGGTAGQVAGSSAAPAAAAGFIPTTNPYSCLGIYSTITAGSITYGAGGQAAGGVGSDSIMDYIAITTNGAGGGGGSGFAGGNMGAVTPALPSMFAIASGGIISGGGAGGASPGNGADGYGFFNPLAFVGGCGGGASNSTTTAGAKGGDGSYGCGGGGGGAGGTNGGGAGGNGGPGFVIITSW